MADKGEAKSYKAQSFNTTEGGLFCGYVAENNAKFAVALRRILPSPNNFKRDHYIALQILRDHHYHAPPLHHHEVVALVQFYHLLVVPSLDMNQQIQM